MHSARLQITRYPLKYFRLFQNPPKIKYFHSACFYGTGDDVDLFTSDIIEKYKTKPKNNLIDTNVTIRQYSDSDKIIQDISKLSIDDINDLILYLVSKNKNSQIEVVLNDCMRLRHFIGESSLKNLFRHYSASGKPDMIVILQSYCLKLDKNLYKRNGGFTHYVAKAQCLKGNSDKGLSILKQCYDNNENLRSLYRIVFRDLIQDSVVNGSEASLVIFKKYVLEFSETWKDHYPLVCLWHMCWSSSWFSDQMLADNLLESSESLQEIIKDRATAFSITILRNEYNEDAVMRLLQSLLRFEMMNEYVKVLQVLFNYKLRNRDIRGCSEIIKNCEVLGVHLPSVSQGKYIKLLIEEPQQDKKTDKPPFKSFKLKF